MKKLLFVSLVVFTTLLIICGCDSKCNHEFIGATCEKPAECVLCGATTGSPLEHHMLPATCSAPATCSYCKKTEGNALSHVVLPATCTTPAICTLCNATVSGTLEHIFFPASCTSPEKCVECGTLRGSVTEHTFSEATCTEPRTCTVCNTTSGVPKEHNFKSENCLVAPVCEKCGAIGEPTAHTWLDASCTAPKRCSVCSATEGELLPHDWQQISCSLPRVCSFCNAETSEGIVHNLVLESCLTPRYCKDCDYKETEALGHNWQAATCKLPSICTQCKLGNGAPLGHDMRDATCESPKSCSRCDLTEGEAIGHNWSFSSTIAPTCGAGAHVYSCNNCQKTRKDPVSPKPGQYHICDENGLCSVCGVQYDVSKMTLVGLFSTGTSAISRQGIFESPEVSEKNLIYKTVFQNELGLPIVDISGDLSKASNSSYIDVSIAYDSEEKSFESIAQLKIQGASSAGYPKKNYSIKLYDPDGTKNKVKVKEEWGKQFKYCLKANWVDYSQARNVVSGQLYGDVIDSRGIVDELTNLPSGGAIDGFPCVVYNNGQFLGLYTFNIPKDKWMFDMKDTDEKNQAIVMAITWNEEVAMRREFSYNASASWTGSSGWELEYASNEDSIIDNNTAWVAESLNNLIRFVINNDGDAFKYGIHNYLDIDKTIDSMLHTFFICADDNISKNILWATYDGVHWFSSVYDMDGTWGMQWNGNISFRDGKRHPIDKLANNLPGQSGYNYQYNLLWEKIYLYFYDEVVERYWELRASVYTMEHITQRFEVFFNSIPDFVREAEKQKWTGVPTQNEDHFAQILDFAQKRIALMDDILMP